MGTIATLAEVYPLLGINPAAPTTTEQAVVTAALVGAAAAVRRFLRYDPVKATRIEFYPQMDFSNRGDQSLVWEVSDTTAYVRQVAEACSSELQVAHLPIREIVSLKIDYDGRSGAHAGGFGAGTVKVEGVDFWPNYDRVDSGSKKVCSDGIIRSEGLWPAVAGSVKIEYIAGYSDSELHGADAVIDASQIWESVLDETQRRSLKMFYRAKRAGSGFSGPLSSERLGDYQYTIDTTSLRQMASAADVAAENVERLSGFARMDLGVM